MDKYQPNVYTIRILNSNINMIMIMMMIVVVVVVMVIMVIMMIMKMIMMMIMMTIQMLEFKILIYHHHHSYCRMSCLPLSILFTISSSRKYHNPASLTGRSHTKKPSVSPPRCSRFRISGFPASLAPDSHVVAPCYTAWWYSYPSEKD